MNDSFYVPEDRKKRYKSYKRGGGKRTHKLKKDGSNKTKM